jgi:hypothetical protein
MKGRRAALFGAAACVALALPGAAFAEFRSIEVHAEPFSAFAVTGAETKFGELEFRGGIVLTSPDQDFGALSGLALRPDGKSLVAIADTGLWFTGTLVETGGKLTGLADTKIAPILDSNGAVRRGKRFADAESVRLTGGGSQTAIVSFEQSNEVSRFDARDLSAAAARPIKIPAAARALKANYGLETVAVAPATGALKGATVLVEERALGKDGNHRAWIVGGPKAGAFSIRHAGNFDVTDGEFLPNGDLVILERLFNPSEGLAMRIRRIPGAEIAPGRIADGPIVMTANLGHHRIDNMEGLALRPGSDGETSLFIVSDDNKSFLQQTLILKFAWRSPDTQ